MNMWARRRDEELARLMRAGRRDEELAWFAEYERERDAETARVEERNRLAQQAGERAQRTRFRREQRREQRKKQTHERHLDERWEKEVDWWDQRYARRCGATTRKDGHPCWWEPEPGKKRCKFHGGRSTGPKTAEGRAKISEVQRRRWEAWRAARLGEQLRGDADGSNG